MVPELEPVNVTVQPKPEPEPVPVPEKVPTNRLSAPNLPEPLTVATMVPVPPRIEPARFITVEIDGHRFIDSGLEECGPKDAIRAGPWIKGVGAQT